MSSSPAARLFYVAADSVFAAQSGRNAVLRHQRRSDFKNVSIVVYVCVMCCVCVCACAVLRQTLDHGNAAPLDKPLDKPSAFG